MLQWQQRILFEISILSARFQDVNYDDEDFSWVHIPCFDLPLGWNQYHTGLLIELPTAYPDIPPDGFYVDKNLRPTNGRPMTHYFEDQGHYNPYAKCGWAWYCIHPSRTSWRPSAHVLQGDNLLKYIELIRMVLTQAAS